MPKRYERPVSNLEHPTEPHADESTNLDVQLKREIVIHATDTVSEVLETSVSISMLIHNADDSNENEQERIIAKRSLRAISTIAIRDTEIARLVGKDGIYDYTEGVVLYGASDKLYLDLMKSYRLTAAEATGIYALRELVLEQAQSVGMAALVEALRTVGLSPQEAGRDPEMAMSAFDEAGFFTDHIGGRQLNSTVFYPKIASTPARLVSNDPDGSRSQHIIEDYKDQLKQPFEQNEEEAWQPTSNVDYLKKLGF